MAFFFENVAHLAKAIKLWHLPIMLFWLLRVENCILQSRFYRKHVADVFYLLWTKIMLLGGIVQHNYVTPFSENMPLLTKSYWPVTFINYFFLNLNTLQENSKIVNRKKCGLMVYVRSWAKPTLKCYNPRNMDKKLKNKIM